MAASISAMRFRNRATFLLSLAALPCLPQAAFAQEILPKALSDRELSASVAGTSVAIAFRAWSQDAQSGIIENRPFQPAFGIQTIDRNSGTQSIGQAATSLTVRATLTMAAPPASGF
jgi:hypothetical protein